MSTTYEREREPFKDGDAGDIEQSNPTEDPIVALKSQCSDPQCDHGLINRGRDNPRVCPCLYQARVDRWLYEMQFEKPVEASPLEQHKTPRIIVQGSTWATTTRHLARGLLTKGIATTLNNPSPKGHRKVRLVRLSHIVDAVLKSKRKFAPYAGSLLVVRTTAGSARQKDVNADCFQEFLGFAADNRLPVWLVDEPSERLEQGHRAWSPDVDKALKEMKFVRVEIEPAPDLDLSLLDRVEHVPPPTPPVPPRPAYVHHDPAVTFPDGNVPTSAVDAAGMLAPRARGVGPAYAVAEQPIGRRVQPLTGKDEPPEDDDVDLLANV